MHCPVTPGKAHVCNKLYSIEVFSCGRTMCRQSGECPRHNLLPRTILQKVPRATNTCLLRVAVAAWGIWSSQTIINISTYCTAGSDPHFESAADILFFFHTDSKCDWSMLHCADQQSSLSIANGAGATPVASDPFLQENTWGVQSPFSLCQQVDHTGSFLFSVTLVKCSFLSWKDKSVPYSNRMKVRKRIEVLRPCNRDFSFLPSLTTPNMNVAGGAKQQRKYSKTRTLFLQNVLQKKRSSNKMFNNNKGLKGP